MMYFNPLPKTDTQKKYEVYSVDKKSIGTSQFNSGIYAFFHKQRGYNTTCLYVGRSKHLRARVRSVFSGKDRRNFYLSAILEQLEAHQLLTIIMFTEKTALELAYYEKKWIKKYKPICNVKDVEEIMGIDAE